MQENGWVEGENIVFERRYFRGDFSRLAQVIGNLLSNAAKYTEPGGVISISAERVGDENGIDIRRLAAEHKRRVAGDDE